jgi:hypothetical protein
LRFADCGDCDERFRLSFVPREQFFGGSINHNLPRTLSIQRILSCALPGIVRSAHHPAPITVARARARLVAAQLIRGDLCRHGASPESDSLRFRAYGRASAWSTAARSLKLGLVMTLGSRLQN